MSESWPRLFRLPGRGGSTCARPDADCGFDYTQEVNTPPCSSTQFPDHRFTLNSTATFVFFAEYCNPAAAGFVRFDFDFVSPIYGLVKSNGMLVEMVASLGIIFLARNLMDRSLIVAAAQRHSHVLKMSAQALADVETAKSDEMLATVWLFALHEVRDP